MTPQPSRLAIDGTGTASIRVSGVIDSHTADDLDAALVGAPTGSDLVVDVSGVDFIDSSGLRSIVSAHQRLEAAGQRLVLSGASDAVSRLLEITGLDAHLHTA